MILGDVKRYVRSDKGELARPVRTPQGLRVEGYAGRPGIYKYTNTREDEADGLGKAGTERLELRPESETFAPDVISGFEAAPFTKGHPGKLVSADPKLRAQHAKGTVLSARRDGDKIAITATIHDPEMATAIERGELSELSPGYTLELERAGGTDPKYGRYDAIQRKITVDHLAGVPRARGGRDMALRLDADGVTVHTDDEGCAYGDEVEGCKGDCQAPWMNEDAELDADKRNAIADKHFALSDDRKLPIHDKGHVIAAMGGHGLDAVKGASAEDKAKAAKKIVAAAKKHGIDSSGFAAKHGLSDDADKGERGDAAQQKAGSAMAETIDELKTQRDEAKAALSRMDAELTSVKAQLTEASEKLAAGAAAAESTRILKATQRADAAEKSLRDYESTREATIRSAAELRMKATMLLGPSIRLDGKSDDAVCVAVLKTLTPKEPYESKDPEWRRVRVDELVKQREANERERDNIARAVRGDASAQVETAPAGPPKVKHADLWSAGPPQTAAMRKKEH